MDSSSLSESFHIAVQHVWRELIRPADTTSRELRRTLRCPGSEGAVLVDDVVERQGYDEEGAVAGCVHLEGHVALVQPHRFTLFGQRRLKQLPRHLGAKM